ncbi:hypothetical protein AB0M28_21705 [Streptomyces sp. NPDC051940]|uniref:hypothetical protein n=1 Tax=Streptomyces sp. NPDC051940 TaxID=3155675 RepID=UPI00344658A8
MAVEHWAQAVRAQLALGRLLPLGDAAEGTWIAESAAASVLMRCAAPGLRPTSVRLALADPETAGEPAVPPPASALPPGPLRIECQCEAGHGVPLREAATALRLALLRTAEDELGLLVDTVDVHIAALVNEVPPPASPEPPRAAGSPLADMRIARETPDHAEAHIRAATGHPPLDAAHEARTQLAPKRVTVLVTGFG